jgi:hypothetical protein
MVLTAKFYIRDSFRLSSLYYHDNIDPVIFYNSLRQAGASSVNSPGSSVSILNFLVHGIARQEAGPQRATWYLMWGILLTADHRGRAVWGMDCLKHWDRGFEFHLWHGCLCAFILCLCCPVCRQPPCDGLIPRPRSPTDCVKDQKTEKAVKVQPTKWCRAIDEWMDGWVDWSVAGWVGVDWWVGGWVDGFMDRQTHRQDR